MEDSRVNFAHKILEKATIYCNLKTKTEDSNVKNGITGIKFDKTWKSLQVHIWYPP